MSYGENLKTFWNKFDFETAPFIHPNDKKHLTAERFLPEVTDLDTFVRSQHYGKKESKLLHSHLLPSPFAGDLSGAKVFILMLNPGFSIGDYFGERQCAFKRALKATLDQQLQNEDFPFMWLNPELSFHPGFRYWSGKLRGLIEEFGKRHNVTHYEASKTLSKRICCIELFPYHSQTFDQKFFKIQLESIKLAKNYVCDLAERAQSGEVFIVVMRGAKIWNLPVCQNIYTFAAGEAQGAHLTPDSKVGRRLMQFIGGSR